MRDMRADMDLVESAISKSMIEVFRVLNAMVADGALAAYAVCGAMAAFEYIEVAATRDIDVTVEIAASGPLVTLKPITDFCLKNGLPVEWEEEGLLISGFPVQFIVASDPLDIEALAHCATVSNLAVDIPIWRVEHLMAKCLQVGRPKDQARLASFLETEFDATAFCGIVSRFDLRERWSSFCGRFGIDDVCRSPSG